MTLFSLGTRSRILVQIGDKFFRMKAVNMPIRVTCQCGQSVNVPESMAGKSGKCPKCQQLIRVPASGATDGQPAKSAAAPKSGAAQKQGKLPTAGSPATANNMAGLLDAAGLVQKSGVFCPTCEQPSRPGAVLCTNCGFNFAEGTKVEGHKTVEKKQFGNKNLNHAAEMMKRDESTQKRMMATGMPWWMMLAMLAGLLTFVGGALIKMDATQTKKISTIVFMAKIQKADWLPVMAASLGLGCLLIAIFSYIAMVFIAFFESRKQGLLCLFVPLYLVYYMFSRIWSQKLLSTVAVMWVTSILAGVLLGYALPKI